MPEVTQEEKDRLSEKMAKEYPNIPKEEREVLLNKVAANVNNENKKFIVIMDDPVKGIMVQGNVSMEEGIILVTKGYVKFQRDFEDYCRSTA